MKKNEKKISDFKDDKKVLNSDLLAHVLGGLAQSTEGRCSSKYNDSIYVKLPPLPR
ncbi:hypothetical protein [Flavobacterium oreochromis]|uniref:hypothetical protein n=1 Tax=Flavobacterium oreochromis TaxID=2906078 RepID=UPI0038589D33